MSNNLIIGLVLLAVGITLLVMGNNMTESAGEGIRHAFTGDYSDKTTWFIIGGVAATVGGVVMSLLSFRGRTN